MCTSLSIYPPFFLWSYMLVVNSLTTEFYGCLKTCTLSSLIFVRLIFHDFCNLKKFMKLNSCEKKVLRKLKTQNLDIKTLIKVFHLLGAYMGRRAQISVQRMSLFLIIWRIAEVLKDVILLICWIIQPVACYISIPLWLNKMQKINGSLKHEHQCTLYLFQEL